jgi:hypothetical protein
MSTYLLDTTLVLLCYKLRSALKILSAAGYRVRDGRYPSEDPDGRRHLSTGPDGSVEQTSHSSQLSRPRAVVLPAQVGPKPPRPDSDALLPVWRREFQWTTTGWLAGKLALHRAGEAQQRGVAGRCMAHSAQSFPPADLCCGSRRGCGR